MITVHENNSKQTTTKLCALNKGLFSLSSGFSAEISVFVQTGDSVQLDIQTQQLPEFDDLYWTKDKSENIVKYTNESKKVTLYKDSIIMYFNTETFSFTMNNTKKTDSGLYKARTSGKYENDIVAYRVSVIGEFKVYY